MKRLLALLVLVVATATVVAFAGSATSAAKASTCTQNPIGGTWINYGGYQNLAVGQIVSITINEDIYGSYQGGSWRAYLSQDSTNSNQSMYVGLVNDGHGIQTYIEQNGVFAYKKSVSVNHNYTVSIYRPDSTTYLVSDGLGDVKSYGMVAANELGSRTQAADKQSGDVYCNSWQFEYSNPSPDFNDTQYFVQSPLTFNGTPGVTNFTIQE